MTKINLKQFAVSGATHDQVIRYNSLTGLWEPATVLGGGGDGIVAAPTVDDKNLTPLATGAANEQDTGITLSNDPAGERYVTIIVNGQLFDVGDGVKTEDCYFSRDGGTTALFNSAFTAGDRLYWNSLIAGFQLDGADDIDLDYDVESADGYGAGGWTDDGYVVRLTTISDNVGIGTSLPSEKLHVIGNTIIDGKLTVTGAIDPISLTLEDTISGTGAFIKLKNGVAVSSPSIGDTFGLIRYNNSTKEVQVASPGGNWLKTGIDDNLDIVESISIGNNPPLTGNIRLTDGYYITAKFGSDFNIIGSTSGITVVSSLSNTNIHAPTTVNVLLGSPVAFTAFSVSSTSVGVNVGNLLFGSIVSSPTIKQTQTTSGDGEDLTIEAQTTTDAASDGGDLILSGGDGTNNNGSILIGKDHESSASQGICIGSEAKSFNLSEIAHANGSFTVTGDAQTSCFILRKSTTSDVAADMFLDGSITYFTLEDETTYHFDIDVVARGSTSNESAAYHFKFCADRTAGVTALVGAITKTVIAEDVAAWDVNVSVDGTGANELNVTVTGEAGKKIKWVAFVRATQVLA